MCFKMISVWEFVLTVSTFSVVALLTRALYLIYNIFRGNSVLHSEHNSFKTIYCIGSGGHTTEMLRIISNLDAAKYQPRLYIMAMNDVSSESKIYERETKQSDFKIFRIPRSRNVKQSYVSSVFTTLYAIMHTIPIIYKFKPDVIFCNGPGTCIPICIVAFLLRCVFILNCKIVFIESFCRVRTLSLSGKILQIFADHFIVQWPQLINVCYRAKYFGRLT